MAPESRLPDDPVAFIQDCVHRRRILWATYELVEAYPDDKYLPSYLILARHGLQAFHVLFAIDVERDNVRVVTSYDPDPGEWRVDLKTRRPKS